MSDETDYIRHHIDAAYEEGQGPSPVTDAILQIADHLKSVGERVDDLENHVAVGTIHPAELDEGGGGDGAYPLRDLPNEPPSFARTGGPEDGVRIVFWAYEAVRPTLGTVSSGHGGYFSHPNSDAAQDKLVRDGRPNIILSGQMYGAWLPATHCRIDGEPPEEKPEVGRAYAYAGISGGEHECPPLEGEFVGEWGINAACWDHTDTDDEGEDDPHAHLPGDLRDPEHWTPEDGERVVYWTHTGGDGAWVGSYRSRDGGIVKPGASGEHQWGGSSLHAPQRCDRRR